MAVWEFEGVLSVLLFAVTLPIGLWFLVYHHYHRHGTFRGWSAFLTVATFFYVTGLVSFTLFPFPDPHSGTCALREGTSPWQLVPFTAAADVMAKAAEVGFIAVFRTGVFLQVFFNVVMLLPLGALLAYRYRKGFGITVLAGLGVSLLIEVTQGTGVWGLFPCPYRLADIDDLIANTAGAAIGWVIGSNLSRFLPDATGDVSMDIAPPHVARRVFAGAIDIVVFVVIELVFQAAVIEGSMVWSAGGVPGWVSGMMPIFGAVVPGLLLFLVVPLLEPRRATPGQIAAWLGEADASTLAPASASQVVVRFAVRWLPILVATFFHPMLALAAVAVYETVAVAVRRDRRSLASVAAGTTTVTRRSLEARGSS